MVAVVAGRKICRRPSNRRGTESDCAATERLLAFSLSVRTIRHPHTHIHEQQTLKKKIHPHRINYTICPFDTDIYCCLMKTNDYSLTSSNINNNNYYYYYSIMTQTRMGETSSYWNNTPIKYLIFSGLFFCTKIFRFIFDIFHALFLSKHLQPYQWLSSYFWNVFTDKKYPI